MPARDRARQTDQDELRAAYGKTVTLVRPDLAVLLCRINPSLWPGETLAARVQPAVVAFLGLSSYRAATGDGRTAGADRPADPGVAAAQHRGLNASWQLPPLAEVYAEPRHAAGELRLRRTAGPVLGLRRTGRC